MIEDVKENIQLKHYSDEHTKITQIQSQIHLSKGEFCLLLNSNPDILRLSTFKEFLKALRSLVFPEDSLYHFEALQRFLDFQWDSTQTLSSSAISFHKLIKYFFNKLSKKYSNLTIPEEFIYAITTSSLYTQIPKTFKDHNRQFVEHYDYTLPLPIQIQKFLQNFDGRLYSLPTTEVTSPASQIDVNLLSNSANFTRSKPTCPPTLKPSFVQRTPHALSSHRPLLSLQAPIRTHYCKFVTIANKIILSPIVLSIPIAIIATSIIFEDLLLIAGTLLLIPTTQILHLNMLQSLLILKTP